MELPLSKLPQKVHLSNGLTPLMEGFRTGDLYEIGKILERDDIVNSIDLVSKKTRESALIWAITSVHTSESIEESAKYRKYAIQIFDIMIRSGNYSSLKIRNFYGITPLYWAIYLSQEKHGKTLITVSMKQIVLHILTEAIVSGLTPNTLGIDYVWYYISNNEALHVTEIMDDDMDFLYRTLN